MCSEGRKFIIWKTFHHYVACFFEVVTNIRGCTFAPRYVQNALCCYNKENGGFSPLSDLLGILR